MILIAGATGFLGGEICRRLAGRESPYAGSCVRRRTTRPWNASEPLALRRSWATCAIVTSLDAACRGVRTVVTTITTTRSRQPGDSIEATDEAGQLNLVDAARAAGVEHFVYVSYSANLDDSGPLTHAKRAVEQRIRESGMSYTILRPSYFMEVWLSPHLGFDFKNRKATVYGAGKRQISFISLGDVAEFAVRAVRSRDAGSSTIELGGPNAVSPLEAVRIFEEVAGAPFEVQHVPESTLRTQFAAAPDSLQKSFAGLMLDYASGDEIPMEHTLRSIPVQLTSVRDYARNVLSR
jgi:NADH dehydrogenase